MYANLIQIVANAHDAASAPTVLDGWHIERAANGLNGVVYHAHNQAYDLAVKFAKRDQRRRAWREYMVTKAIRDGGIDSLCAQPLYLSADDADLPGDVLISTWLSGTPMVSPPPATDRERWNAILQTMVMVHRITPDKIAGEIPDAVMYVQHPTDLLAILQARFVRFSDGQYGELSYAQLAGLIDTLEKRIPHEWHLKPPVTLIHCDSHPANMIEDQGKVRLVDWEGAGWSDPAFDISNMTSQWRYADLPQEHFDWMQTEYAKLSGDYGLPERVRIYSIIQNVQWVITLSGFVRQGLGTQIEGTHQHSLEHHQKYQMHHWERSWQLLNQL